MKRTILAAAFIALLGSAGLSWSADGKKGLEAAKNGAWATYIRKFHLDAEQGDAEAQFLMGVFYEAKGEKEVQIAVIWWKLAAEQGHADAQFSLGGMYLEGKGVPKDIVYSHMWIILAAANGHPSFDKMREAEEKDMTPAQIAEAQKLARECERKKYKEC
jgi:TPR repeat protein